MLKAKYVSGLIFSLAVIFFASASYAEDVSGYERGIYQDLIERWHQAIYAKDGDFTAASKEIEVIYRELANKYNISVDEVKRIDNKGLASEDLSDQDYKIFDELTKALNSMPGGGNYEESERIHANIASKYGISLYKLHEIEYEMEEGMWGWF